ncbi:MAG: hypothetical protein H0X29_02015 [Parachlamydiaceae bacterium]|nr:hypothetical protein [Parachlamydiaceae bacterium]
MNNYNTYAASALRIGCFAANAALSVGTGNVLLAVSKATVLGGYYVVSRLSTSWLGNKVVSKLAEVTGAANTEQNRNRALAISTVLNVALFIPSVMIACKLAAFSGIALTFCATFDLAFNAAISSLIAKMLMTWMLDGKFLNDVLPTTVIGETILTSKFLPV